MLARTAFALLVVTAACRTSVPDGAERGPCYGNHTCDPGLACLSDLCVRAPGIGSGSAVPPPPPPAGPGRRRLRRDRRSSRRDPARQLHAQARARAVRRRHADAVPARRARAGRRALPARRPQQAGARRVSAPARGWRLWRDRRAPAVAADRRGRGSVSGDERRSADHALQERGAEQGARDVRARRAERERRRPLRVVIHTRARTSAPCRSRRRPAPLEGLCGTNDRA